MGTRLELHSLLKTTAGINNVYFQPPESIKMSYPAIVYNKDAIESRHADNTKYTKFTRYSITVIDSDPDTDIPDSILSLPMTSLDRYFVSDNLNHYVITLYY